jgi:hypothetical protein
VDPLTKDYPWYTPYQFAGNKPIYAIDLDGLEEIRTGKDGKLEVFFQMDATTYVQDYIPILNDNNSETKIETPNTSTLDSFGFSINGSSALFATSATFLNEYGKKLKPKVRYPLGNNLFATKAYAGDGAIIRPSSLRYPLKNGIGAWRIKPNSPSLTSAGNSLFKGALFLDVGATLYSGGKTINKYNETGSFNTKESGEFLAGAGLIILGTKFPLAGPALFSYELVKWGEGEQVNQRLQNQYYDQYMQFRNSDSQKSDEAKKKYYEFGGDECIDCGLGTTFIGPEPKK